ncbi:hypothetical protein, partial [Enterobacter kobei]|uniref:hypothetical protein n=1 Tax=Enterobacter kobei TaxID=208224 RepID=UPI0029D91C91
MYMEHPFTASEISGSWAQVAQSSRPLIVLFFILMPSVGSPANDAFFRIILTLCGREKMKIRALL